ncbi:MAG: MucBP domain-containing protein, partial [Alphaproteobacteria bacterium]|nr:MucBP domain-containing protein [Alphaproteobacteria bacterium]
MEKIKAFLNSNKTRVAVIIIALLAAVICCVFGEKYISKNNQGEQISESTESYNLAEKDRLVADTEVQSGTVTVHYVDEKGNALIENTVKTGNVGDIYEIERPTISMYVSADEEPLTKAGKYEIGNTDVTFKYKKAVSEVYEYVEKEGEDGATENKINIAFNNTKSRQEYGLKIITKDENGNVINGGEFKISKNGSVLRTGKVRGGDLYAGIISVSKEGKLTYDIEETKATIGYEKLASVINLGINVTWNEESKKFEIVLDNEFPVGVSASIKEN